MKVSPYIWALINRFGVQILNLANTVILARFLYPDDFGRIGVLAIFINLSTVLADSGMGGSLIKERELTSKDYDTVFTFNLIFSLFLYALLYILAPALESFFQMTDLAKICRVISLPIILGAITIVPRAMAQKQLLFKQICKISLSAILTANVLSVTMARLGFGVWALAFYGIFSSIIENIGYGFVIKYRPNLRFYTQSFNKVFSFGLYTTLSTIIDTIYENFAAICIGKYSNAAIVGYFSQAKKVEESPTKTISAAVGNVAFPILCKLNNPIDFKEQAQKIQTHLLSLTAPIMCLMSIFSEDIIVLLLGSSWINASSYLSLLCFSGLFGVLESTNRTFIKSTGNSYTMLKASIIKRSLGISLIMLCAYINVNYIVTVFVVTSLLGAAINAIYLAKLTIFSIPEQVKVWGQIMLPCLIAYTIGWYAESKFNTGWWSVFSISLCFLLLYFTLLDIFRVDTVSLSSIYKCLFKQTRKPKHI